MELEIYNDVQKWKGIASINLQNSKLLQWYSQTLFDHLKWICQDDHHHR